MPELRVTVTTEGDLSLRVGLEALQAVLDGMDGRPAIQKLMSGNYLVSCQSGGITLSIQRASLADAVLTCVEHIKATSVRTRVKA